MKLIKINTTENKEDDFLLLTDLTHEQIIKVIDPMVALGRISTNNYTEDDLFCALDITYPDNILWKFSFDNIDEISI
jgi:hypothetical protein